jgi:hypothetical protein
MCPTIFVVVVNLASVIAVTQHTTAFYSIQVVDMILMKGLLHKYHIPQEWYNRNIAGHHTSYNYYKQGS